MEYKKGGCYELDAQQRLNELTGFEASGICAITVRRITDGFSTVSTALRFNSCLPSWISSFLPSASCVCGFIGYRTRHIVLNYICFTCLDINDNNNFCTVQRISTATTTRTLAGLDRHLPNGQATYQFSSFLTL